MFTVTGRRLRDPFRRRLTGLAYAAAWRGVRVLPEPVAAALFARSADLAARRGGRGYTRLRANLARVVEAVGDADVDLDALARAAMRSYARYWLEVFRLEEIGIERLVSGMRMVDEHYLRDSHAAGRGTIVALPHMGNWDQAGAWAAATGIPFTTVAERLEPTSLFDRFVALRTALGMEVIPLTGVERPPFETLAERLRAGGLLCLLADRDLTDSGVRVRFFSGTASMPAGPAALALKTGATLLPTTLWFDGEGWAARIHPPVEHSDVEAMTQALADAFAEGIAAHPADWHMLQRVFVDDIPAPRAGLAGSARSGREAGRSRPPARSTGNGVADKTAKAEKTEKKEEAEEAEKTEKAEKAEKVEKVARAEKIAKAEPKAQARTGAGTGMGMGMGEDAVPPAAPAEGSR